jgi:hypothetical protein
MAGSSFDSLTARFSNSLCVGVGSRAFVESIARVEEVFDRPL